MTSAPTVHYSAPVHLGGTWIARVATTLPSGNRTLFLDAPSLSAALQLTRRDAVLLAAALTEETP